MSASGKRSFDAARALLAAAFVCLTGAAPAQEFPNKPVKIVVPFSPGNTTDTAARFMAEDMSKILEQPFVVENRPGADTVIGLTYVAKQVPADGYTLAAVTVGAFSILPLLYKNLRFEPSKDLPPFVQLPKGRTYMAIPATLPFKTFADVVNNARANPGKLNYGASSPGVRFLMAAVIASQGLNVLYVPYSEGGRYLQALAVGEVQMGMVSESVLLTLGQKLRPLAQTGTTRNPKYPDVPTMTELGLSNMPDNTYSLNAPAATPKAVVDKLHAAAARALLTPETRARFEKIGLEFVPDSPDGAIKDLAAQEKFFSEVANKIGFKPQ